MEIFQLTAVNQNDPDCNCGADFTAEVTAYQGGSPCINPPSFPYLALVPLPIPPAPDATPRPSPTWFLCLDSHIEEASFTIVITGGGASTTITVAGANMPGWVEENQQQPTNQIYRGGDWGIFGYAQKNQSDGQPTYWIYTVTAAATNPKVNG